MGSLGWESPPPSNDREWPAWLAATTSRVMACNSCLSKAKKHAQGTCVKACTKKIQLAEIHLQRDPSDVEVRSIVLNPQGKFTEVFQDSVERNKHLSASKWLRYGDTCSRAFFDFHRIGKKTTFLRELETKTGTITGQGDLSLYITDFYARLYSSDALASSTEEAQSV